MTAFKADNYKIYSRDAFSDELFYMGISCPVCDSVLQTLWHEHFTFCNSCENFVIMHHERLVTSKIRPTPPGFTFVEMSNEHPNHGIIKSYDDLIDINTKDSYRSKRVDIKNFVPKKNFLYKTANGSVLRYTNSERDLTSDTVYHKFVSEVLVNRDKLVRIYSSKSIPIIGETMYYEGPIYFFKDRAIPDLQIITEIGKKRKT